MQILGKELFATSDFKMQAQSVILCLEPIGQAAEEIVQDNLKRDASRTAQIIGNANVEITVLAISLPSHGDFCLLFGRGRDTDFNLKDKKYSREHMKMTVNRYSGELRIHRLMLNDYEVRLDGELLERPPYRAVVHGHHETLHIGPALFKLCWPALAPDSLPTFRRNKVAFIHKHIQPEVDDDETDHEMDSIDSREMLVKSPKSKISRKSIELAELGRGQFGVVTLCANAITGDYFARKRTLPSPGYNVELIRREIRLMSSLNHVSKKNCSVRIVTHLQRNIVRLLGHSSRDGHFEIDLEYCTLGDLYACRSLVPQDLRRLGEDIASALIYLEKVNVLHRDLKPANVLGTELPNGFVCYKVADFGFGKIREQTMTFCGSPMYMAPEVIFGGRQTAAMDVYSFGILMLEESGGFQPDEVTKHGIGGCFQSIQGKAKNFRPDDLGADFLRLCITRDSSKRPSAAQCYQFLTKGTIVGLDIKAQLRAIECTPGPIAPQAPKFANHRSKDPAVLVKRERHQPEFSRAKTLRTNRITKGINGPQIIPRRILQPMINAKIRVCQDSKWSKKYTTIQLSRNLTMPGQYPRD